MHVCRGKESQNRWAIDSLVLVLFRDVIVGRLFGPAYNTYYVARVTLCYFLPAYMKHRSSTARPRVIRFFVLHSFAFFVLHSFAFFVLHSLFCIHSHSLFCIHSHSLFCILCFAFIRILCFAFFVLHSFAFFGVSGNRCLPCVHERASKDTTGPPPRRLRTDKRSTESSEQRLRSYASRDRRLRTTPR